jgi:dTDP-4-amino-4,6-dideoxygalactose transaminase
MTMRVPFLTLVPGGEDASAVRGALERVVERGWFVLGPELSAFEDELAAACGTACAVGVGNGTDAIALTLRALGIGPGDEVITTPLSAAFSALAILMAGATPVFADIDEERLTIDPSAIEAAITPRTAALLPVHLYGQPADMTAIAGLARRHGLAVVEDACQAHLATSEGRPVGTIGAAGALSFYPTKNLGALGDGGAVITNDRDLAPRLRRLRNGGQTDRYHHPEFGVNSRLDELQAAVLRERLVRLPSHTARRRALAARYRHRLQGLPESHIRVPPECDPGHVYHLFPIRVIAQRADLMSWLENRGIGTLIHYPVPIPQQGFVSAAPGTPCSKASQVCEQVCSLPLYPQMADEQVDLVADEVRRWSDERR